jgi:hypothetical protein
MRCKLTISPTLKDINIIQTKLINWCFYSPVYGFPDFHLQYQLTVEETEVDICAENILTQER